VESYGERDFSCAIFVLNEREAFESWKDNPMNGQCDQFLASLSQELRTPLTSGIGPAESGSALLDLERILKESDRLLLARYPPACVLVVIRFARFSSPDDISR
jgi:hypothetical protein